MPDGGRVIQQSVVLPASPQALLPEHDFDGVIAGWPEYYWGPWRAWLEKPRV